MKIVMMYLLIIADQPHLHAGVKSILVVSMLMIAQPHVGHAVKGEELCECRDDQANEMLMQQNFIQAMMLMIMIMMNKMGA